MYGKLVRVMYDLNMVFQALFCLGLPILLAIFGSSLLVKHASAGEWIYAVLVPLGVLAGLWSMVRFLLKCARQIRALEAERERTAAERRRAARAKADAETAVDASDDADK